MPFLTFHSNHSVTLEDSRPTNTCWLLPLNDTITLAATWQPLTSYMPPTPSRRFSKTSIMERLSIDIQTANPGAAMYSTWMLACHGHVVELLYTLIIAMLKETAMNTHILARWVWWFHAVKEGGWQLSEDEWVQLCLDVAFVADTQSNNICDDYDLEDVGSSKFPTFSSLSSQAKDVKAALAGLWLMGHHNYILFRILNTWLARPLSHSNDMWEHARRDPTEACIVFVDFPKVS